MNESQNDEIDLFQLIETLWKGKWIIVGFILASFIGLTGYQSMQSSTVYTAKTKINTISIIEREKYEASNKHGFFPVSEKLLMNTFIAVLNERYLFEEGIHKFNLLEKTMYEDDIAYNEAIVKLADSIELVPTIENNKENKDSNWIINFEFYDKEKWMKVLKYVDTNANEKVRNILLSNFNLLVSIEKQKKNFELEDILIQIENIKNDYERQMSNKIEYLNEQAAIARILGIEKNTIEAQTDTPFYLRGYIAIEKEIELIESREKKEAFIENLIDLEQKQREIIQNSNVKRAAELFAKIPISNKDDFKAVSSRVFLTKFETDKNKMNIYVLTLAISGMLGIFYVIVRTEFRSRKSQQTKES